MRIDKFLKVSRIIKRRTVAQEACSGGRITVNGKVAKPGTAVKLFRPDACLRVQPGQQLCRRGVGGL